MPAGAVSLYSYGAQTTLVPGFSGFPTARNKLTAEGVLHVSVIAQRQNIFSWNEEVSSSGRGCSGDRHECV